MPTLWCVCGHVLAAQTDYLPYQGQFFAGRDGPGVDHIVDALAHFISEQGYGTDDAGEPAERGAQEGAPPAAHAGFDPGMLTCEGCGRIWMRTAPHAGGKYLA